MFMLKDLLNSLTQSSVVFDSVQKAGQYRYVSNLGNQPLSPLDGRYQPAVAGLGEHLSEAGLNLSLIHISEPTRPY